MPLTLDIVTSRGPVLHEDALDRIVVRRREPEHDPGSEVAICAHHAPLLMQTQACSLRLVREKLTRTVAVDAGVIEVLGDRVTLVVT